MPVQVSTRSVLYMLCWCAFFVDSFFMVDVNLALLYISTPKYGERTYPVCFDVLESNVTGRFDWSPYEQGCFLGAFYWAYPFSQFLGSCLTRIFGTKKVMAISIFVISASKLVFRVACVASVYYAILLRFLEGILSGFTWPALYVLMINWIPRHQRGYFMTSFQGRNIGYALSYILSGVIAQFTHWGNMFYFSGGLGLVWLIAWIILAYNTPDQHPWITENEYQYIMGHIDYLEYLRKAKTLVPRMKIATSKAVWAAAISTFGQIFLHFLLIVYTPMYITVVFGYNILLTGVLSGSAFIITYFIGLIFAYASHKMVETGWELTMVRKVWTAVSQVIPGVLLIALFFVRCSIYGALLLLYIALIACNASAYGTLAIPVDIAPNFAGSVISFTMTIQMCGAIFIHVLVYQYTLEGHSKEAWNYIFLITGILGMLLFLFFLILGSAKREDWNTSIFVGAFEGSERGSRRSSEAGDSRRSSKKDRLSGLEAYVSLRLQTEVNSSRRVPMAEDQDLKRNTFKRQQTDEQTLLRSIVHPGQSVETDDQLAEKLEVAKSSRGGTGTTTPQVRRDSLATNELAPLIQGRRFSIVTPQKFPGKPIDGEKLDEAYSVERLESDYLPGAEPSASSEGKEGRREEKTPEKVTLEDFIKAVALKIKADKAKKFKGKTQPLERDKTMSDLIQERKIRMKEESERALAAKAPEKAEVDKKLGKLDKAKLGKAKVHRAKEGKLNRRKTKAPPEKAPEVAERWKSLAAQTQLEQLESQVGTRFERQISQGLRSEASRRTEELSGRVSSSRGRSVEAQPCEEQPGEEQPGEEQPGEERPGGQTVEGQPGEGQLGEGQPGQGQPREGQLGEGQLGEGQPGEGSPDDGEGVSGSQPPGRKGKKPKYRHKLYAPYPQKYLDRYGKKDKREKRLDSK